MTNATIESKVVLTHHQKKTICMIDHVHADNKAPAAQGRFMNVYCPEYKVQYTRPMTPAEKKEYR
jgi:hypothetical protein